MRSYSAEYERKAVRFLGEFDGFLVCDGYATYNALKKAKRCGHLTHVRRYWVNALPKEKSAYETSAVAKGVPFLYFRYSNQKLFNQSMNVSIWIQFTDVGFKTLIFGNIYTFKSFSVVYSRI